jgi:hypothetical protein
VGPRASLDGCRKSRPPPGFDPRTIESITSLYTDYATMQIIINKNNIFIMFKPQGGKHYFFKSCCFSTFSNIPLSPADLRSLFVQNMNCMIHLSVLFCDPF